jgi:uncharacterized protein (TIGR03435 family)
VIYAINGAMVALSSSLAASILTKATFITTMALAAARLARAGRAAVRHAMLVASFAALLVLPAASLLVRPVRIAVTRESAAPSAGARAIDVAQTAAPAAAGDAVPTSATGPRTEHEFPLYDLLLAGWTAGAAVFVLRIIAGLREVHLLRRSGLTWRDGQTFVDEMASDAGIRGHVEVLLHQSLATPVTCGVFHPAIVLPFGAQNWHGEDLNRAIIHELEHVRRGDWMSQCLARAVCAVYWFLPLVWIAWRKLVLEAERACDDAVLRRSEGTAYADQLVKLARRLSVAQTPAFLAMASSADLATRVDAVLDVRQRRGRAGIISLALAYGGAAALVTTISPLTLVGAPQNQAAAPSENAAATNMVFEVASVKQRSEPLSSLVPDLSFIGTSGRLAKVSGNRVTLTASLRAIIAAAYNVKTYQIAGEPPWADTFVYVIEAKSPGDAEPTQEQIQPMLRSLLADRFRLRLHRETKDFAVYNMTLMQGQKNTALKPAAQDETFSFSVTPGPGGTVRGKATKASIVDFVQMVSGSADRPVIDKTGLTGDIDWDILIPQEGVRTLDDRNRAFIEAAKDQLGLKLEPSRNPIEILVVDAVAPPSEN